VNADRNIRIAFLLSLLVHASALLIHVKPRPPEPTIGAVAEIPLTVRLVPREAPQAEVAPPLPEVAPVLPTPVQRPVTRPVPRTTPLPPVPKPVEIPEPVPVPAPAPPAVDMLAMINARRDRRRALEASAARREGMARETSPDEATAAAIARNLQSINGREGVSGVFEILSKGTRTAEYAFNGWRPDSKRKWREVIEVDAGQGGDVERAIVRSMITLIRRDYKEDFNWESHRLGRVVVLSARPEDNSGLEDFLVKEFFGTPTLGRGR
jgi:outer membrane biosynthesis protein TonB